MTQERQKQAELLGKVASGQQTMGSRMSLGIGMVTVPKKNRAIKFPHQLLFFPDVGLVIQRYRQKNLLLEATTKNASLRSILKRFCEKLNYGLS